MALKAVIFDVGETLVNEGRWWAELGRLAGVEPHVVWAAVGATVEHGERPRAAWELLGVERPSRDAVGWEGADLYEDATPCLRRLRASGYLLGLAGNVGRDLAPFIERFGLDVDFAVASETLGVEKPDAAFFRRLVEVADHPADEIAYVGDRVDNDVRPARAAGMIAVHIRRGPWGHLQRGAEEAHVRIDSLDELPEAVAGV